MTIEPALGAAIRGLLLKIDAASRAVTDAMRKAEEAEARARAAEAVALRMLERLRAV